MKFTIGDSSVEVHSCVLDCTSAEVECLDFMACPFDAYEGCSKCPFSGGATVTLEELVSVYLEVYKDAHNL